MRSGGLEECGEVQAGLGEAEEEEAAVCRVQCVLRVRCTVREGGEQASSCFQMVSSFPALLAEGRLPLLNECLIWSLLTPFARVFSLNIF